MSIACSKFLSVGCKEGGENIDGQGMSGTFRDQKEIVASNATAVHISVGAQRSIT
jgi:hypothetical protein